MHDDQTHTFARHCYAVLLACARSNAKCSPATRRPEPFGHGINIKGRVNIVNNLCYNGPSGADDKFVDMKSGRDERQREREGKSD